MYIALIALPVSDEAEIEEKIHVMPRIVLQQL